ncbi:unnamed protein product, partial [Mesorhabditis belari]|uniref:Uncharacterized protein n=1 Tax=Mesorhabditis belari TaxID=2138241 RepID=A0AAF3EQ53_9BILA
MRNLVFAILLLGVVDAQSCNQNSLKILANCYSNFVAYYGFDMKTTNKLPAYWDMHNVRQKMLLDQGLTVQPKICDVATSLYDCSSKVRYGAECLTQLGANTSDAQDWMTDRAVGEYQCTTGYATLIADFTCIGTARDTYAVQLQNCSDQLDIALKNNPINACKDLNDFLGCQPPYYASACDFNAGVFMCGVTRAGINAGSDLCDKLGLLDQCAPYK